MDRKDRIKYAKLSLDGIALGDSFGQSFFVSEEAAYKRINERKILEEPWYFTDDTVMGIGVYRILEKYGMINQDKLAAVFGQNYLLDWHRGYGGTAHSILTEIGNGGDWRKVASSAFDGMGSMGNGAAMRVAPIGAYFVDDLEEVIRQASASAEITHSHLEGMSGAIATAVATAFLLQKRLGIYFGEAENFLQDVANTLPESDTKYKILSATSIKKESKIEFVTSVLGNGTKLTAQDTVPFCLWCVAYYYESLEEALWKAVSALGDRDTICAIVGGIIAPYHFQVPEKWLNYMEHPEDSIFFKTEIE